MEKQKNLQINESWQKINSQDEFKKAFAGTYLSAINLEDIKLWVDGNFCGIWANVEDAYYEDTMDGVRNLVLSVKNFASDRITNLIKLNDFYTNIPRKSKPLQRFVGALTRETETKINGLTYAETLEIYGSEIKEIFDFDEKYITENGEEEQ